MITRNNMLALVSNDDEIREIFHYPHERLTECFGELFSNMKGYDQNNPHHCYNLLEHSIYTCVGLQPSGIDEFDFQMLRVAALYHDVGKPLVAQNKDDRTVFYGHAERSAEIAEPVFCEMGFHSEETEYLCFLIANHDLFISFLFEDEIPNPSNKYIKSINAKNVDKEILRIQKKYEEKGRFVPTRDNFVSLMSLCIADANAQNDTVLQNGRVVNSKTQKVARLTAISSIISKDI